MRVIVGKSNITGGVWAPSSKSLTIRALVCAALSQGDSEIINPLVSNDTLAAVNILKQLGTTISREEDVWKVTGGKFRVHSGDLDCGESATTMRFMTALCSLIPGQHTLVGGPSLSRRPIGTLVDALVKLGVKASAQKTGLPPVIVEGGNFKGGITEIAGNVSSQFISALLLIGPFAPKVVSVRLTTPLTSRPYVLMTLRCLKQFGIDVRREANMFIVLRQRYQPTSIKIEGDWSSASYFLALGATSEEGVVIQNLSTSSVQGDRVIIDMLRNMGARLRVSGSNIAVAHGRLKAIGADLSDCIDLLPTMAVLAALAKGTSVFTGIQRARLKESNRVAALKEGLTKLGVEVGEEENRLSIKGMNVFWKAEDEGVDETLDEAPSAAEFFAGAAQESINLRSHDDHRIAMAFAVLGSALGNVAISGAECVTKTYPDFWKDFQKIGGEIQVDEQQSG
jgi:3-phosphoshikimate 1-carboxyvinyltransferase